jgi:hypothetical protein
LVRKRLKVGPCTVQAKVEVSYMEIYNEKVHDLLDLNSSTKIGLKVGVHHLHQ